MNDWGNRRNLKEGKIVKIFKINEGRNNILNFMIFSK